MKVIYNQEEKELVRRSQKGDSRAQLRLYRKYVKAMYNTVIRMVPNSMDAEDIIQESFVRVFQHLHTFKGDSTLGAWIKRITVNTALNHIRKNKRVSFVDLEFRVEVPVEREAEEPRLDMKTIHHAIKTLPEGARIVLSLRLLEGYQHKEIAQILGITESTSKTQYQRGRRLLQQQLRGKLKDGLSRNY